MAEDASAIETGDGPGPTPKRAGMRWSLSNKLLLLTVLFVMVAEVLIYIPSIAYYRNDWLRARLESAALVAMAASAAGGQGLPAEVERSLLAADQLDIDFRQQQRAARGERPTGRGLAADSGLRQPRASDRQARSARSHAARSPARAGHRLLRPEPR